MLEAGYLVKYETSLSYLLLQICAVGILCTTTKAKEVFRLV